MGQAQKVPTLQRLCWSPHLAKLVVRLEGGAFASSLAVSTYEGERGQTGPMVLCNSRSEMPESHSQHTHTVGTRHCQASGAFDTNSFLSTFTTFHAIQAEVAHSES
jgi:hypothetical protein